MPNYPQALAHIFSKEPRLRTRQDIREVVQHYRDHALRLTEKMMEGRDPERRIDCEKIALIAIEDTARNHSEHHGTTAYQRWYGMAQRRILAFLKIPTGTQRRRIGEKKDDEQQLKTELQMVQDFNDAKLHALFVEASELILRHVRSSRLNRQNKKALARIYGKNGTRVEPPNKVAADLDMNHQLISQAEKAVHHRVRRHRQFGALEARWQNEIRPALEKRAPMERGSQLRLKRVRLERLFKQA